MSQLKKINVIFQISKFSGQKDYGFFEFYSLCPVVFRGYDGKKLGKQNPSGKLTTTWAAWEDYSAEGTFGDWDDTYYNEGIYVGYRYFDSKGKNPLFSFGDGLSYTEFAIKTEDTQMKEDTVAVRVKVKNIGKRAGKEVV